MNFISASFLIFLLVSLLLYYIFPLKYGWVVLLAGSFYFYYSFSSQGFFLLLVHILISYAFSRLLSGFSTKPIFIMAVLCDLLPLIFFKYHNVLLSNQINIVVPLGISFYTLQMIAYHTDIYRGHISPQTNILKYGLFISFFPQILQGPIPRYQQLGDFLFTGNRFNENNIRKGFHYILWGLFLKLMIADKTGIIVNSVFNNYTDYYGLYYLIAGILYSIQLYADFLSCTTLAQGIALLFGIELVDNFNHPYFATSIKDFWRRWHLSLSNWLKDYVYIPLGGNRNGRVKRYLNLLITFAISGLWHGVGIKFLCWGILHGIYQIIGELTGNLRNKMCSLLQISSDSSIRKNIKIVVTFLLVTLGWIIFRADSLSVAVHMIYSIFTDFTPWVIFNDSLLQLGLDWKEWMVLIFSIYTLYQVSNKQESHRLSPVIAGYPLLLRWFIYIAVILIIAIFGSYGSGYDAQSFIYEGF